MAEQDCARCGARLAAGATWCSLCYAPVASVAAEEPDWTDQADGVEEPDFVPESLVGAPVRAPGLVRAAAGSPPANQWALVDIRPDPDVEHAVDGDGRAEPVDPVDEEVVPAVAGSWPCLGCDQSNPMDAPACTACGLPFLALAKSPPALHVPGVGDIFKRSRGQQIAFVAVSGLAFLGVLIGLMALLGAIF